MRKLLIFILFIIFFLFSVKTSFADEVAELAMAKGAAETVNMFAFDMYKQLIKRQKDANVAFSPLSIASAFGMVHLGCEHAGQECLAEIFHYTKQVHPQMAALASILKRTSEEDGKVKMANAVWITNEYVADHVEIPQVFSNALADYYDSKLVRFENYAPDNIAGTINAWTEEQTGGMIKDVVAPDSVRDDFIITNAMYFNGKWMRYFLTVKRKDFYAHSGVIDMDMMSQGGITPYYETKNFQAVQLHYQNKFFSMLLLLPKGKRGLRALETKIDKKIFDRIVAGLREEKVFVTMPKFSCEIKYDAILYDLAKLSPRKRFPTDVAFLKAFHPKQVIHQLRIDVKEAGTEAAAFTLVKMGRTSAGVPDVQPKFYDFIADHPFLYFIMDNRTGAILFMGSFTGVEGN